MTRRPSLCIVAGLLLALPLTITPAQQPGRAASAPDRGFSVAELRAAGRAVMEHEIARHGRVQNPEWQREIDDILRRIAAATAYPGLQLTYAIVGSGDVNAAAAPGGYIIIYRGLIEAFDSLARRQASDPQSRRELHRAYLASVLAHEVAHVTLGHSDSLLAATRRRALLAGAPDTAITEVAAYLNFIRDEDPDLARLRHGREVELAADRAGALYQLRAGWEIQHAMDLFRAIDAGERAAPGFYHIGNATYFRSHPRSSDREAQLEALRGRLKLHQGEFDDALTLVRNGIGLDSAVALLDRVLADFPDLLAAQHARATALQLQWVQTVPVQQQLVRASFPTYTAHFLPGIRGAPPGSQSLLRAARAAYQNVLAQRRLAYTLSNLAVMDAYAGDFRLAQQRADSAVRLEPQDVLVMNNLGVVQFLAGQYPAARRSFERAQGMLGDLQYPPVIFNLARTLAALRDPGAPAAFERYLALDAETAWANEARRLLGRAPVTAAAGTPGGRESTVASSPTVAGIRLGLTRQAVITALGQPDAAGQLEGLLVWRYMQRGISMVFDPQGRVALIVLGTPAAGTIDGIRPGDPVRSATAKWGAPSDRDAEMLYFNRGAWFISLEDAGGTIGSLGIGVNEPAPQARGVSQR